MFNFSLPLPTLGFYDWCGLAFAALLSIWYCYVAQWECGIAAVACDATKRFAVLVRDAVSCVAEFVQLTVVGAWDLAGKLFAPAPEYRKDYAALAVKPADRK